MSGCDDGVCMPESAGRDGSSAQSFAATNDSDEASCTRNNNTDPKQESEGPLKVRIEVISDTMCPWCWVGKRNLELALKSRPDVDATVEWLPYFLDKDLPEEGKHVRAYYRDNYGDPLAGEKMQPSLVKASRKVGLDFETCYSKLRRYRPTIRSHRLIELAKRRGKQDEMVEELFRSYYVGGKHLNSIEHLVEAADALGIEGAEAYLKSDEDDLEVCKRAAEVKDTAQGVPTFLISRADRSDSRRMTFSGARPPEIFIRAFDNLRKS